MSDSGDETVKMAEQKAQPERADGAGALSGLLDDAVDVTVRKAKKCKNVTRGICHILATFNNTKVSFADPNGNVISWASSGKCNFRGSRKSTAYAAQIVVQDAGRVAMSHGMKDVTIKVSGPGMGRDSAIRAIQSLGLSVDEIIDVTPIPHNGCRPRKVRRA
jgi:small subunit ribosomal protein S11